MLHSNINDFFGSEILWNFELDSSRPRHLTSLRLYYIQGLRFGQSIEPCGMTSCSPPCSLVRCCVFLMGPMASATVVDFGISTSGNILLDIIWWYTVHVMYMYIYISYTYKETATLDISDFWYKYTIYIYQYVCIYIYIQSYTLYYSVILYIYIYAFRYISTYVLFSREIGWFERMLPDWQPSEATLYHGYPWLFVSICPGFGMLVLECQGRSGGGGSLWCWNCEIPMSKMDGTSWKVEIWVFWCLKMSFQCTDVRSLQIPTFFHLKKAWDQARFWVSRVDSLNFCWISEKKD